MLLYRSLILMPSNICFTALATAVAALDAVFALATPFTVTGGMTVDPAGAVGFNILIASAAAFTAVSIAVVRAVLTASNLSASIKMSAVVDTLVVAASDVSCATSCFATDATKRLCVGPRFVYAETTVSYDGVAVEVVGNETVIELFPQAFRILKVLLYIDAV